MDDEAKTPDTTTAAEPATPKEMAARWAELTAQVETFKKQAEESTDRWMRAVAELDNYRKRMQREMEAQRLRDRETLLLSWIEVIDNMERALASEGAASNPWYDGVEAIHQQMLGVLKKFGAQPFDARGEPFDPERHDAVATANLPGQPEGKIVEVVQTGYLLDGKVLRHAKVIPVKH